MLDETILFIHVMKTGGTTFRAILEELLGNQIYPTNEELELNPRQRYLEFGELKRKLSSGKIELKNRKVIVGHYPFIISKLVSGKLYLATFLRDPFKRSLSMIGHRRRMFPELSRATIADILSDQDFVDNQIRNYQTKVFAIEDLELGSMNYPYRVGDEEFLVAKKRLFDMAFVGITDHFQLALELFFNKTGIAVHHSIAKIENKGIAERPTMQEIELIKELVDFDQKLYECALARFLEECEECNILLANEFFR